VRQGDLVRRVTPVLGELGCRGHRESMGREWNVRLSVLMPGPRFRGSVQRDEAREVFQYHRCVVHHSRHRKTTSRSLCRASNGERVEERVGENHRSTVHHSGHRRTTSRSSFRASSSARVKERVVENHLSAVHQCGHRRTTSRIGDHRLTAF
jgi:hypothetical protein